jgi:hypothetical protein
LRSPATFGCDRGAKKYPRQPIIEVAEMAINEYDDLSLSGFCDRVRGWLKCKSIPEPGDTVLDEICKPIYCARKAQKNSSDH